MLKFLLAAALLYLLWRGLQPRPAAAMAEAEAREILGVAPGADADAIRAAHRRLVQAVHPDRGGSAELTRRINVARDTLLRKRN